MEVRIVFDTEKESVEDLKKLLNYIQELINKKEGNNTNTVSNSETNAKKTETRKEGRTAGGCRVVPYEDMTKMFSSIFSGKKKRGLE